MFIVTSIYFYSSPSGLKILVCSTYCKYHSPVQVLRSTSSAVQYEHGLQHTSSKKILFLWHELLKVGYIYKISHSCKFTGDKGRTHTGLPTETTTTLKFGAELDAYFNIIFAVKGWIRSHKSAFSGLVWVLLKYVEDILCRAVHI
jgi:hypothetical protein